MALSVKIASRFGVLEYWSVGKSESPNVNLNESFHCSITPAYCHKGVSRLKPPKGQSKAGCVGLGFFT